MKVIELKDHPKIVAKNLAKSCTLINRSFSSPTCYRYLNYECGACEVPEYYAKAKKTLTELILNNNF
jgi:hypothetical protein